MTLAVVMLDGVDINLEQVKSGFAWVFEKYIGQSDASVHASYRAAQLAARQERRGLWSDTRAFGSLSAILTSESPKRVSFALQGACSAFARGLG